MVGFIVLMFAVAVYYVEHSHNKDGEFKSITAGMWWAVITTTTVGYGDVYPESAEGKIIGAVAAIIGVLIASFANGMVSQAMTIMMEKKSLKAQAYKDARDSLSTMLKTRVEEISGPKYVSLDTSRGPEHTSTDV